MSKQLTAALTGLLVIAGLLGGCGGSSNGDGASNARDTATLTKAEFLKQGDEICRHSVEGTEAAIQPFLKKHGVSAIAQLSQSQEEELSSTIALPRLRIAVEELSELDLPKEEEQQAREVVAGFEEGVAGLEADPSEAARFEYVNQRAQAFGFEVCGKR